MVKGLPEKLLWKRPASSSKGKEWARSSLMLMLKRVTWGWREEALGSDGLEPNPVAQVITRSRADLLSPLNFSFLSCIKAVINATLLRSAPQSTQELTHSRKTTGGRTTWVRAGEGGGRQGVNPETGLTSGQ